jgi:hypothetical protein
MGMPIEGRNSYFTTEGFNTIILDVVNPLGIMANYQVTIQSPVLPSFPQDEFETPPDFELSDFLVWGRAFRDYLSEEESFLMPIYTVLEELAKEAIRYNLIRSEARYKQLVALYIAHYMEIMLHAFKDEANNASLNPFDKEKDHKKEFVLGNEVFEDFKTTTYGKIFWHLYKPYGQWRFLGVL